MSTPSKKKGTGGETELVNLLHKAGVEAHRTPASSVVDLRVSGYPPAMAVLATRPDHGEWLVTIRLGDFVSLLPMVSNPALDIEVKRYARFSLHTIFNKKFGKEPSDG